jgi:hypothetical protein
VKTDDTSNPTPGHTTTVSQKVVAAQCAILDKLAACELKFAEVYAAYSNLFPATGDFWASLSKEESGHADMLESVKRFLNAGHYFINIGTLAKGVESVMKELDHEVSMAKHGYITEPQAFNHAIGFESRLIDGHFYDIVKCGAPEFLHMAGVLRKGCEFHRVKIRERMLARKAELGHSWTG